MDDKKLHAKVAKYIFKCSEKLSLKDLTIACACSLYHDFFNKISISLFDPHTVAATSIYLATKVEEQHTRLRDVVNVCYNTLYPDKVLELNEQYWKLRDSICSFELLLLRMLNFDVAYVHPHKFILHYLLSISKLFPKQQWESLRVSDITWALLRDSYVSNVCLKHPPKLLSIALIHLALQCCEIKVPLSEDSEEPWWKVIYENCTQDKIDEIQCDIIDVYNI